MSTKNCSPAEVVLLLRLATIDYILFQTPEQLLTTSYLPLTVFYRNKISIIGVPIHKKHLTCHGTFQQKTTIKYKQPCNAIRTIDKSIIKQQQSKKTEKMLKKWRTEHAYVLLALLIVEFFTSSTVELKQLINCTTITSSTQKHS